MNKGLPHAKWITAVLRMLL